ncbi:MAG: ABC transporter ATP-binding protein/permease [Oscillospiraceae bacterium]|jgi:ATP-binding cassette subfamily B protein|nr:ABC transporter ATP-binding protein/permease [Oscillospiraceae bacterium]
MNDSYIFHYDLNEHMRPCDGTLRFSRDGRVSALLDGVVLFDHSLEGAEEAAVLAGVGCGLVYLKRGDGEELVLCRFSMSSLLPAGEFCKVVNYYIQTKTAVIPEQEDTRVCEKCGRTLIEGLAVCLFCYSRSSVLKRALELLRPFRRAITWAQTFVGVASVFYLLIPLLNRHLIDRYLEPMNGPWIHVVFIAGAMLLARCLSETIFILSSRAYNRASLGYANRLRTLSYDKLQRLSMSSLSKRTPGDLIRRVMEDTNTIKDFITDIGRWGVEQAGMFVIVLIILFFTNPWLTLLVVLPLPVVTIAMSRFWDFIHIRYERQWRRSSKCNSILHDIIKGIRTVKSFGNEDREIDKFAGETRKLAEVSSGNEKLWALLFPSMVFFTGIGEFLVLYFGGSAILDGGLSLGILVQFTMYIAYVYAPLRWLVSFPRWLADAMTSMVKVFEILDEEPDITGKEDPSDVPLTGGVRFDSVSFGYKSYEPVLKDISLDIKPGEMIGIVGKSGVGKTTLINLLMRLYDPNAGGVSISGTDLRDMSPEHLHENVGVVFQDTFLFAGTIYDNIIYAKPGAAPEEVIAACKAGGAHDFIMKMPDGYNTVIGENGHTISGGERQRLAIARAVIKNPPILILDEATSSLDVETEAAIQDSLQKLTKGRTTIAIAHRLSTLRAADRLIVLDKGKVAEIGTHMELLKMKGIYYDLVMAQRQTSKKSAAARQGD